MVIENAKYTSVDGENNNCIVATVDGIVTHIPLDLNNRHYAEILRQVEAGTLTIEDAE